MIDYVRMIMIVVIMVIMTIIMVMNSLIIIKTITLRQLFFA